MNDAEVFAEIYRNNRWGSSESSSGPGSTAASTRFLAQELPLLFKRYAIGSILDIPCGDFNWMRAVDMTGIEYIGADIVGELIAANRKNHPGVTFEVMDMLRDDLPRVDLIICRDCLVHFPLEMIQTALANIKRSRCSFLLTTTFTWRSLPNRQIKLGQWRRLNLTLPPFNLPQPVDLLIEGTYEDKSMALWPVYML